MSLNNHTNLTAEIFRQFNLDGVLNGVVAVRGDFDVMHDEVISFSAEQRPFQWSDVYEGDPHDSLLIVPSDFVPFKPGTDVTVLGSTFAPEGRPRSSWTCGVRVAGRLEKTVRVHGPRWWEPQRTPARPLLLGPLAEPQFTGWRLAEAEPATSAPLSWRLAHGGPRPVRPTQQTPPELHPFNGLGPGLLDVNFTPRDQPIRAPQIEAVEDPIVEWRQDHTPQGFAPVPPWWRFRQRHVGTVDDAWIAERHPILPRDFDYRFYQAAHPDLVADPWLRGDEVVEFGRMHASAQVLRARLPGVLLAALVRRPGLPEQDCPLVLDGVHADLRGERPRMTLTWRTSFPYEVEDGEIDLRAFHLAPAAAAS